MTAEQMEATRRMLDARLVTNIVALRDEEYRLNLMWAPHMQPPVKLN